MHGGCESALGKKNWGEADLKGLGERGGGGGEIVEKGNVLI